MAAGYRVLHGSEETSPQEEADAFAVDVLRGLSAHRKSLPSKYFYDARGSELFRQISMLPEYYLTECELEIIDRQGNSILQYVEDGAFNLVELGAGFSRKTIALLDTFVRAGLDFRYVPIDISEAAMDALIRSLNQHYPRVEVEGLVTDHLRGLKWLVNKRSRRNFVLFLGSSIGNYDQSEASVFLRTIWNVLNNNDHFLIGFDLNKDIDLLMRAYNDSRGLTSEFNYNLLHRINRELGGTFDVKKFRHFGTYNPASGGMESYLVSAERQSVHIARIGRSFDFDEWETVQTEYSGKYLMSQIEQLASETGYEICEHLVDSRGFFADSIWRVTKTRQKPLRTPANRHHATLRFP